MNGSMTTILLNMLTTTTSAAKILGPVTMVAEDGNGAQITVGSRIISQMRILAKSVIGICPLTYFLVTPGSEYEVDVNGQLTISKSKLLIAHRVTLLFIGSESSPLCYLIDPNGNISEVEDSWSSNMHRNIQNELRNTSGLYEMSVTVFTLPEFNTQPSKDALDKLKTVYNLPAVQESGWCLHFGLIFMIELICTAGIGPSARHLTHFINFTLLRRTSPRASGPTMTTDEQVIVLLYSYALAFALYNSLKKRHHALPKYGEIKATEIRRDDVYHT